MKQVIFIGGTAYSGSTLLDMILAHDPAGFSCGELSALLHPYLPHHLVPNCGCGAADCQLWPEMRERPEQPHIALLQRYPQVRFLVDSSKSPIWIHDQTRRLHREGIATRNVLIWKTPAEFFASRSKRGLEAGWIKRWIDYHHRYFSLVGDWVSVRYADLVGDPRTLPALCERLGLEYFDEKAEYWRQRHHTVFGNSSAKIHLHGKDTRQYQTYASELSDRCHTVDHRTVRYASSGQDVELNDQAKAKTREILEVLERTDVHAPPADAQALRATTAAMKASPLLFAYQRSKRALVGGLTRLRASGGLRS